MSTRKVKNIPHREFTQRLAATMPTGTTIGTASILELSQRIQKKLKSDSLKVVVRPLAENDECGKIMNSSDAGERSIQTWNRHGKVWKLGSVCLPTPKDIESISDFF